MDYTGHIENGRVVLEGDAQLPEGAKVRVELIQADLQPSSDNVDRSSLRRLLLSVAGKAEGLPADAAKNIDHYLYGLPKVDE